MQPASIDEINTLKFEGNVRFAMHVPPEEARDHIEAISFVLLEDQIEKVKERIKEMGYTITSISEANPLMEQINPEYPIARTKWFYFSGNCITCKDFIEIHAVVDEILNKVR